MRSVTDNSMTIDEGVKNVTTRTPRAPLIRSGAFLVECALLAAGAWPTRANVQGGYKRTRAKLSSGATNVHAPSCRRGLQTYTRQAVVGATNVHAPSCRRGIQTYTRQAIVGGYKRTISLRSGRTSGRASGLPRTKKHVWRRFECLVAK